MAKLKKERAALTRFDEELADLDQVIKAKKQEIVDVDLEIQQAEHDHKSMDAQLANLISQGDKMEKKYPWIEDEKR